MSRANPPYRIFLCLCFAVLTTYCFGQAPYSWIPIQRLTPNPLRAIYFVDTLTGWVAGKNGVIFKTTDGGSNWVSQSSGTTAEIVDIQMLSSQKGWMMAKQILSPPSSYYGSFLLTTTNGGATWSSQEFYHQILYTVNFLDSLQGWIGGEQGFLNGTSDGGVRWFEARYDSAIATLLPVKKIRFWSPSFGIAVGGISEFAGFIRRTTNNGSLWSAIQGGSDEINDFLFVDSMTVIGIGGGLDEGTMIMRSIDAGQTFTTWFPGMFGVARSLSKRTGTEYYGTLNNVHKYLYSSDTGITWEDYDTPGNFNVSAVTFIDENHGFMAADSGVIYKYNPLRTFDVQAQWNIVSVPVTPLTVMKDSLFPTSESSAFEFNENGYGATETLAPGQGYWLKFPSQQTITFGGYPINGDTLAIREGWNMIGTLSEPIPLSAVTMTPETLHLSSFFGYNNGYYTAETLEPGKGYWVKSDAAGFLYLQSPVLQADMFKKQDHR